MICHAFGRTVLHLLYVIIIMTQQSISSHFHMRKLRFRKAQRFDHDEQVVGEESNQILPPEMVVSCKRACIHIHTCSASPSSVVLCSCLWTALVHATPVMYGSLATPSFSNWIMCGQSISTAVVCSLRIPKSFPVAHVVPLDPGQ